MEPSAVSQGAPDRDRSQGIYLTSIAGIPVFINPSWFVVFSLVLWSLAWGYFPRLYPDWPETAYWTVSFISALLFFLSVLIHELAHSLVALQHGVPIKSITLYIFGGVARMNEEPREARVEALVAAAGPLSSLGLAVMFLMISFLPLGVFVTVTARYLGTINLILAVFNMLPGFPLDGGRLLRAHLWGRWGNLRRATRIAARTGHILAYLFMGMGAVTLLFGGLIGGLWWLIIGWFLDNAARSGYQHVVVREVLEKLSVRNLMQTDVVWVPADLPASYFIDRYLLRYPQRSFPVSREGGLVGLVTMEDVGRVPVEDRNRVSIGEIMTPRDRLCIARPDDSAYEALQCMVNHDIGRLPVMTEERVIGLISRDQLLRAVALKPEND